ncbi:MAG: hypothetical protein KBS59_05090 [Clostridiales bacterium]|nr:hypothetical protein [Clostridiales bacterium]
MKALFEYQKFERNTKLEALIKETENRYEKKLSDEELLMVCAAGDTDVPQSEKPNITM